MNKAASAAVKPGVGPAKPEKQLISYYKNNFFSLFTIKKIKIYENRWYNKLICWQETLKNRNDRLRKMIKESQ